jgi:hypothetical protein
MNDKRCPTHDRNLYGGPVQFWCPHGDSHHVMAADLSHDYEPKAAA